MTRVPLFALAILLSAVPAEAKPDQALRGLFCNTRAQLEETLDHMRLANSMAMAVSLTNRRAVACVHAYKIRYVVTHPVIIGRTALNGQALTLYEATLVKVLVGGNPRPVEPPLQTFFVPMDKVSQAEVENGA